MTQQMTRRKTTNKRLRHKAKETPPKLPFIEHLLELRRRLFYVAVSIGIWATGAYFVQHQIVDWLLAPADGQQFIYTSVGGGIDFLFRVCLYTGVVFSIPVIIYQILRYIQPLIGQHSTRFIVLGSIASGVLALAGIAFGYFLGLPAALGFLLHQFNTADISALITIQSYLSFVLLYLAGSSLMFQVPLVMFFINRIKPLTMKAMMKKQRWVILISFIAAALINPSPRAQDMAILAVPMVLSYQIGVGIVWYVNRKHTRPANVQKLLEQDSKIKQEREARLKTVEYVLDQSDLSASLAPLPTQSSQSAQATSARGTKRIPIAEK